MKVFKWYDFKAGWFCGDFTPSMYQSKEVEVAIKKYNRGDYDPAHKHLLADEITMVIQGQVEMNGQLYVGNDIILIEKGEITDFRAISDAITCVVKIPSVKNDKYLI